MTVLFDCCESDEKVGIVALNFLAALKLELPHFLSWQDEGKELKCTEAS